MILKRGVCWNYSQTRPKTERQQTESFEKNLHIVNNFEHKDSAVILTMKDRMVEVYEHLSIIAPKDVYGRIRYIEWIFKKKNHIDFKSVILHWNNYLDKDNGSSRKL